MNTTPEVLHCSSVEWTNPTDIDTVIDFIRVSEIRYEPKKILGGNHLDMGPVVLGFEDNYIWHANQFGSEDISMLATYEGQTGILKIRLRDGRQVVVNGRIYFTPAWKMDGLGTMGHEVKVTRLTPVASMAVNAPVDSSDLLIQERTQYQLYIATEPVAKNVTSITANTSPYTRGTVVMPAPPLFKKGKKVTFSGNTQTLYNQGAVIREILTSQQFRVDVPVAAPTNGTGGTATAFTQFLVTYADFKLIIKSNFKAYLFLKNFKSNELSGDNNWFSFSDWKTSVPTFIIRGTLSEPDQTEAESGFGDSGWLLNTAGVEDYPAFSATTDESYQLFAWKELDSFWAQIFVKETGHYQKRLKEPEILEPNSKFVFEVREALEIDPPIIGTMFQGSKTQVDVFDLTNSHGLSGTYSAGLTLSKTPLLTGNVMASRAPIQVFRTNGVFPSTGKTVWTHTDINMHWSFKALDQTTAWDAALQYRVDAPSNLTKLRLTDDGSFTEISSLSDILTGSQCLVVMYEVATDDIAWEIV